MKRRIFIALSVFTGLIPSIYAQLGPLRCDQFTDLVSKTASMFPKLEQMRRDNIDDILSWQKSTLDSLFLNFLDANDKEDIKTLLTLKPMLLSYGPQQEGLFQTISDMYTMGLSESVESLRDTMTPIPDSALLAFFNGYNSAEFDTQQLEDFWGDNLAFNTKGVKQCTFSRSHQAMQMYYICSEAEFQLSDSGELVLSYKNPVVKTIFLRFRDQLPSAEVYSALMIPEKCKVHTLEEETVAFDPGANIVESEEEQNPSVDEGAIEGERAPGAVVDEIALP